MAQLLGVRLEEELHTEFKILCAKKRRSMSDVIRDLVQEWVRDQMEGKEAGNSDHRGQ